MKKEPITKTDFMLVECGILNLLDIPVYKIDFSEKRPFVIEEKIIGLDVDDERKIFYETEYSRDEFIIRDGFYFTEIGKTVFPNTKEAYRAIEMFNALLKEREESAK